MGVFAGVLLFIAGVGVGATAVSYNYQSVRRATAPLQKENERLRDAAWEDALKYKSDSAYRAGYADGRRSPMSDVERLADTIEKNHIDFRAPRERRTNGQNVNGRAD